MPAERKTVPIEPTEEMLLAAFKQAEASLLDPCGNEHCKTDEERSAHAVRPLWAAMVAAAPDLAASASSPEPEEWLPIASAPKGATAIWLAWNPDDWTTGEGFWRGDRWVACAGFYNPKLPHPHIELREHFPDPVLWRPLPAPPASRHSDGERSR